MVKIVFTIIKNLIISKILKNNCKNKNYINYILISSFI